MRIAMVCPASTAGVVGGAERLWRGLVEAIGVLTEHTAELVAIESPESSFADLVAAYERFAQLDLSCFDLVISGKYPAWMVRHDNHVIHMCHPLRGLYDTYPLHLSTIADPSTPAARRLVTVLRQAIPGDPGARDEVLTRAHEFVESVGADHPDAQFPGPLIRELVQWLDHDALSPDRIRRHLAISRTVAERDGYFPAGVDVQVAVPPSALSGLREGPYDHIFTASRLDGPKRVNLIVDAMQHVPQPCRLRIAGTGPMEEAIREATQADPRIEMLGRISDEQLAVEYSKALCVPFVPLDEDLGLITLEAQMAAKPVVTCADSGGSVDLVEHGRDGFVVEPTPQAIGAAIARLVDSPELAQAMGARGRQSARRVTWSALINHLLAEPERAQPARRVVALSTYAAEPARHGGQVRINRLYRAVGSEMDVHLIALTDDPEARSSVIAPGFRQTVVRPSEQGRSLEGRIGTDVAVPLGDVVATLSSPHHPGLIQAVAHATRGADLVVLEHPYLLPALDRAEVDSPIVYASHNVEADLKAAMYGDSDVAHALQEVVAKVEQIATQRASLVTAVSSYDADTLAERSSTLAELAVIPNGVDVHDVQFVGNEERMILRERWLERCARAGWRAPGNEIALFVGSGHPPNVAAARHILRMAEELPDVLFVLVGSHVDGLGGVVAGENVLARGIVPRAELTSLLSVATVALNPMDSGSGTNLKMLDYFAAGTPSISTEVGARGLGALDGRDFWEASIEETAEAVRAVISDRDEAERRAVSARLLAEQSSWTLLGQEFASALSRVIDSNPHVDD